MGQKPKRGADGPKSVPAQKRGPEGRVKNGTDSADKSGHITEVPSAITKRKKGSGDAGPIAAKSMAATAKSDGQSGGTDEAGTAAAIAKAAPSSPEPKRGGAEAATVVGEAAAASPQPQVAAAVASTPVRRETGPVHPHSSGDIPAGPERVAVEEKLGSADGEKTGNAGPTSAAASAVAGPERSAGAAGPSAPKSADATAKPDGGAAAAEPAAAKSAPSTPQSKSGGAEAGASAHNLEREVQFGAGDGGGTTGTKPTATPSASPDPGPTAASPPVPVPPSQSARAFLYDVAGDGDCAFHALLHQCKDVHPKTCAEKVPEARKVMLKDVTNLRKAFVETLRNVLKWEDPHNKENVEDHVAGSSGMVRIPVPKFSAPAGVLRVAAADAPEVAADKKDGDKRPAPRAAGSEQESPRSTSLPMTISKAVLKATLSPWGSTITQFVDARVQNIMEDSHESNDEKRDVCKWRLARSSTAKGGAVVTEPEINECVEKNFKDEPISREEYLAWMET
eukprot:g9165.t1